MPRKRHDPPTPKPLPRPAPRFFVPHATDQAQAERVWQATVAFARGKGSRVLEDRIYAASYIHDGKACLDVVGAPDRYGQEEILVILRTELNGPLLICTAHRGVVGGDPILGPHDAALLHFARGVPGGSSASQVE